MSVPHRYIWRRLRLLSRRTRLFVKYRVLHVDDTPHRIALGVGIGFFVTWTPTMGFQMLLTVILCSLFRANKLVGVPFAWISNPATIVPVYYPNYRVGVALTPGTEAKTLADWSQVIEGVFDPALSLWQRMLSPWQFALDILGPLWVGSLVVGAVIGAIMYWITYVSVVRYRRRFGPPKSGRPAAGRGQAAGEKPGAEA